MILRKIVLANWRGVAAHEIEFGAGVNVLCGPNEAGKSTTVEAIEWALYRDVVGGARVKDDIKPIVPAHDRTARPTVTAHLEFSDCTAVVTKTLAENAAARACSLQIVPPTGAAVRVDQEAAQDRLKALLAADGLGQAGTASDAALLISRQGVAADYIGSELSAAVRGTLKVDAEGGLAATSRLESVRAELERKRSRELNKRLGENAIEAAPAGSEAALLRSRHNELDREIAEFETCLLDIGDLRGRIAVLRAEVESLLPRENAARERLAEVRARREAQQQLAREVAECRAAHEAAMARRTALQQTVEEVARLAYDLRITDDDVASIASALATAEGVAAQLNSERETAAATAAAAERTVEEARAREEAWRLRQQFGEVKKAHQEAAAHLAEMETLQAALAAATATGDAPASPRPTRDQCFKMRTQFQELAQLRRSAQQQLQVTLTLEQANALTVRADNAPPLEQAAAPATPLTVNGVQAVQVTIPGVGEISVHCGARELRQQAAEIERLSSDLGTQLAPFGVVVSDLPGAFEMLETLAESGEESKRHTQQLQRDVAAAEARYGTADSLRGALEEFRQDMETARAACEPVRHLFPENAAAREQDLTAMRQHDAAATAARAALQNCFNRSSEHSGKLAVLQAEAKRLEERVGGMRRRLQELSQDGKSHAERTALLEELRRAEWSAAEQRQAVDDRLALLGEPVDETTVADAERAVEQIGATRQAREVDLAGLRAELGSVCARDPATHLEELQAQRAELTPQLALHEARLRAVAILEAVVSSERHRLGRTLAEPMNRLLAPWLTRLRGKDTAVEFDAEGRAITHVRTGRDTASISLPFEAHSAGFKEQVAFVLRLILAQRIAADLPSGRLPLILDDPLTQTDHGRRTALYDVLGEAAANLQILFVTCHPAHFDGIAAPHVIALGEFSVASSGASAVVTEDAPPANGTARRKPGRKRVADPVNNTPVDPAPATVQTPTLW